MGRKPLNDTVKDGVLLIRLSAAERVELDTAANAAGVATSTWLRNLGIAAARAGKPVAEKPARKSRKKSTE